MNESNVPVVDGVAKEVKLNSAEMLRNEGKTEKGAAGSEPSEKETEEKLVCYKSRDQTAGLGT